jgi:membrane-bound serine protease (ClpP class)
LRSLLILCAVVSLRAQVRVVETEVDGIVHPITTEIIDSAIAQADRENASAVVVRLSTPGGLLDATRQIVESVFRSKTPVIMWVGPSGARAASAGFFLLESGDVAAMAPGTNTGASHPVTLTGGDMDATMKQKVENDAAALMRTIAMHRGRNVEAAEKTVRQSVSYTDKEALDQKLIDLIAPDERALLSQLDGREITRFNGQRVALHLAGAVIEHYEPSLRQRLLSAIADPNIALILLVLGALGIYVEFSSPGLVAPGVIGAILVLLGLTALSMFPIRWLGAALILLAFLFFAMEAKFTTHGVLTLGGAVAMLMGALMLINTPSPATHIHLSYALGVTIPFALITTFLLSIAVRAKRNKAVTGVEAMIGQAGVAIGALNLAGTVLVRGEYWSALASAPVGPAEPVRITGVDGLTLRVEPANEPPVNKAMEAK